MCDQKPGTETEEDGETRWYIAPELAELIPFVMRKPMISLVYIDYPQPTEDEGDSDG